MVPALAPGGAVLDHPGQRLALGFLFQLDVGSDLTPGQTLSS
jgi:hypothetical protein